MWSTPVMGNSERRVISSEIGSENCIVGSCRHYQSCGSKPHRPYRLTRSTLSWHLKPSENLFQKLEAHNLLGTCGALSESETDRFTFDSQQTQKAVWWLRLSRGVRLIKNWYSLRLFRLGGIFYLWTIGLKFQIRRTFAEWVPAGDFLSGSTILNNKIFVLWTIFTFPRVKFLSSFFLSFYIFNEFSWKLFY